jgi:cation diffusion facilitator CzcD-associated flavoprotein CzcO
MSVKARTASSFAAGSISDPYERNEFLYSSCPKLGETLDPKAKASKRMEFTTHYCHQKIPLAAKIREVSNVETVCVIGGGVSGVVTARVLLDEGVNVTVLEKTSKLGGVWAENYAGFGVQTPCALYHFPDEKLPDEWDFTAGPMLNNYIYQYAQKHGVLDAVKFECDVTAIEPVSGGYKLKWTEAGRAKEQKFDLVVLASGVYGKAEKFIPNWAGKAGFKGEVLHAADYLNIRRSEDKNVVTVGYGKSAFDCAQISTKIAKTSTLLFRESHWCVPRKVLGLIPFEYATFNRFGTALLLPGYSVLGPIEKALHSIPKLLSGLWVLISWIFGLQFGLNKDTWPKKGFIADYWCGHGVLPHPSFFPLLNSGAIKGIKGQIKEMKTDSLVLEDGKEIPCDVLVAATGYKPVRSFLPKEITAAKEEDGLWLYRNMILPGSPRLVFLNCEATTFTNITTASLQARWLAELLAGRHKLPSPAEQKADIAKTQEWKRRTMPNAGASRAYMIQTHQVHYYDQLLKDMGASIRRKRGGTIVGRAIREILDPYRPGDYDTIVTGEFKYLKGEAVEAGAEQPPFVKEGVVFTAAAVLAYYAVGIFRAGLAAKFS